MISTADIIVFWGTNYARHVFMELVPRAQALGITELCSMCGELPGGCKCGENSNVCLSCGRKLELCTCDDRTY